MFFATFLELATGFSALNKRNELRRMRLFYCFLAPSAAAEQDATQNGHQTPSQARTHKVTSRADDHNVVPPELFAKTLNN